MAVPDKIKILQVEQLSCVVQESLIPHDMFHTETSFAILYMALILSNLIIVCFC